MVERVSGEVLKVLEVLEVLKGTAFPWRTPST